MAVSQSFGTCHLEQILPNKWTAFEAAEDYLDNVECTVLVRAGTATRLELTLSYFNQ